MHCQAKVLDRCFFLIYNDPVIIDKGANFMVKIRLQRFGSHKSPQYRIVAADSKSPRDGRFLEIVGTYNPLTNPATVSVDAEKVTKWLSTGAMPTTTVKNILKSQNITAKKAE